MIQAIIYLPNISKTVFRTRDFQRCIDHDNLLAFRGRPLTMAEFNLEAPKLLSQNTITTFGTLPCVKLVEVPDVVAVSVPDVTPPVPPPVPPEGLKPGLQKLADNLRLELLPLPENVFVEEVEGGYILSDLRDGAAFLGKGESGWQGDVSLVEPFATAEAATAAFGALPPAEEAPAPASPAKKSHHKKK